ncbi:uncharacterized protein LOC135927551 isoform X2 [Gordionus sp. m RMFG-2023]|uniref:uncharacterized protein LOC135927551 isoform X2 n=1 Tax=Gordionus sp. m RMFG-2023 TaxID=3053472 RepID=UPI0031FDE858
MTNLFFSLAIPNFFDNVTCSKTLSPPLPLYSNRSQIDHHYPLLTLEDIGRRKPEAVERRGRRRRTERSRVFSSARYRPSLIVYLDEAKKNAYGSVYGDNDRPFFEKGIHHDKRNNRKRSKHRGVFEDNDQSFPENSKIFLTTNHRGDLNHFSDRDIDTIVIKSPPSPLVTRPAITRKIRKASPATPYSALGRHLIKFNHSYGNLHGYFSVVICTFGIIANVFNIAVLSKRHMINPTNIILIALADVLVMASYLIFAFYMYIPSMKESLHSYGWALFVLFHFNLTMTAHTISTWVTVFLAAFRCLSISKPLLRKRYFNNVTTIVCLAIIYGVVILICLPYYMSYIIIPVPQSSIPGDSHPKNASFDNLFASHSNETTATKRFFSEVQPTKNKGYYQYRSKRFIIVPTPPSLYITTSTFNDSFMDIVRNSFSRHNGIQHVKRTSSFLYILDYVDVETELGNVSTPSYKIYSYPDLVMRQESKKQSSEIFREIPSDHYKEIYYGTINETSLPDGPLTEGKYITAMNSKHSHLLLINFVVYSVAGKLLPCLMLTIMSAFLIWIICKANYRRQKLKTGNLPTNNQPLLKKQSFSRKKSAGTNYSSPDVTNIYKKDSVGSYSNCQRQFSNLNTTSEGEFYKVNTPVPINWRKFSKFSFIRFFSKQKPITLKLLTSSNYSSNNLGPKSSTIFLNAGLNQNDQEDVVNEHEKTLRTIEMETAPNIDAPDKDPEFYDDQLGELNKVSSFKRSSKNFKDPAVATNDRKKKCYRASRPRIGSEKSRKTIETKVSHHHRYKTDKTSQLLLTVLLCFLITEFPSGFLALLCIENLMGQPFFLRIYSPLGDLMDMMALINSSANFIIYCIMSEQFRATFSSMFQDAWSCFAQKFWHK